MKRKDGTERASPVRIKWQQRYMLITRIQQEYEGFSQRGLTHVQAAEELTKLLGFQVQAKTLGDVLKGMNLSWKPKLSRTTKRASSTSWNMRVIARSVLELADSLGHALRYKHELTVMSDAPTEEKNETKKEDQEKASGLAVFRAEEPLVLQQ